MSNPAGGRRNWYLQPYKAPKRELFYNPKVAIRARCEAELATLPRGHGMLEGSSLRICSSLKERAWNKCAPECVHLTTIYSAVAPHEAMLLFRVVILACGYDSTLRLGRGGCAVETALWIPPPPIGINLTTSCIPQTFTPLPPVSSVCSNFLESACDQPQLALDCPFTSSSIPVQELSYRIESRYTLRLITQRTPALLDIPLGAERTHLLPWPLLFAVTTTISRLSILATSDLDATPMNASSIKVR